MIPRSPVPAQDGGGWQRLWREAFTDPRALLAWLGLEPLAAALPPEPPHGFAMRVPRPFASRMRRGDPHDPLLRQVLPLRAELDEIEGYGADAVGDLAARRARGLLVKYRGRALLIATGACAVHCRYCFRRHFPYGEEHAGAERWRAAIAALAADRDLRELILSGGDPLSLATARLAELTERLRAIAHLRTLRLHTRLPVVLPARVDGELLDWLSALPWRRVVVIHANHPAELDAEVAAACRALADAGCLLLNQAVLLRGVNDRVEALEGLSERLFELGVMPYYLHQLDRVRGTAHFAVSDRRARALLAELRARLPGYLVPRLVREVPGAPAKLPL